VDRLSLGDDGSEFSVVTGRWMSGRHTIVGDSAQITEDSRWSSFTGVEVTLPHHLERVSALARQYAACVGLPDELAGDFALAGAWHDVGKADIRFQRWLHGGSEFRALTQSTPLAKSQRRTGSRATMRLARQRAGYPDRYRHELMSLAMMAAAGGQIGAGACDWDLVQHLVASHHGHCRPFAPFAPDPAPVQVSFTKDGSSASATSVHGFERLDSGVAERFWRLVYRYGWWGLAWLEAMFRLADHRQSEREQRLEDPRNA